MDEIAVFERELRNYVAHVEGTGAPLAEDRPAIDETQLEDLLREVEAAQEEARDLCDLASISLRDHSQKLQQTQQMLSSLMKTMSEMRSAVVRNIG